MGYPETQSRNQRTTKLTEALAAEIRRRYDIAHPVSQKYTM
jgi:hypothetical protein